MRIWERCKKKVNAYSKRSTLFTCFIIVLLLIFFPFFHKLFHSFGLCADIVRLFMCDAFIHVAVSILCWLLFRVVSMFFFLYFSWVHNFICKHRLNYMVEYITIAGCCCLTIITVSMLFYFSFFRFSSYYRVKKAYKNACLILSCIKSCNVVLKYLFTAVIMYWQNRINPKATTFKIFFNLLWLNCIA